MRAQRLSLTVATAILVSASAGAAQVCEMPFEAYLTDTEGAPLRTEIDVELRFYLSGAEDELPADCRTFVDTEVSDGWMRLDVDLCSAADASELCGTVPVERLLRTAALDGERVHVGVVIDTGDGPAELAPRFTLGAVPYAAIASRALTADTLGDISPDDVLVRGEPIDAATVGGIPAEDLLRGDDLIDADTLDGFDSLDFLLAGDPIDADTLGGLTADDLRGGALPDFIEFSVLTSLVTLNSSAADTPLTDPQDGLPVQSVIPIPDLGTIRSVRVVTQLSHSSPREIRVHLQSPAGTSVTLHDGDLDGDRGLLDVEWPEEREPVVGTLDDFTGESPAGDWILSWTDDVVGTPGTLESWSLQMEILSSEQFNIVADLSVGGDVRISGDLDVSGVASASGRRLDEIVVTGAECPPGYVMSEGYYDVATEPEAYCKFIDWSQPGSRCGCGSGGTPAWWDTTPNCNAADGTRFQACGGEQVYYVPTEHVRDWYDAAPDPESTWTRVFHQRSACGWYWTRYARGTFDASWVRCVPE